MTEGAGRIPNRWSIRCWGLPALVLGLVAFAAWVAHANWAAARYDTMAVNSLAGAYRLASFQERMYEAEGRYADGWDALAAGGFLAEDERRIVLDARSGGNPEECRYQTRAFGDGTGFAVIGACGPAPGAPFCHVAVVFADRGSRRTFLASVMTEWPETWLEGFPDGAALEAAVDAERGFYDSRDLAAYGWARRPDGKPWFEWSAGK